MVVWADGICINQGDVHEKEAQVQLMGDIYSKAEKTIVWLGEEADGSNAVPGLLEHVAANYRQQKPDSRELLPLPSLKIWAGIEG